MLEYEQVLEDIARMVSDGTVTLERLRDALRGTSVTQVATGMTGSTTILYSGKNKTTVDADGMVWNWNR